MVKRFIELNEDEKNLVCEFLNRNIENKNSLNDFEKELLNEAFDYGNGVLFYFKNGEVLGKIYVVLESIKRVSCSYVFNVDILESVESRGLILKELIDYVKTLVKAYGTAKIIFGMLNEDTLKLAESIGIYKSYSAFEMTLEDKESNGEILDLIPLCEENLEEYLSLHNAAFKDMPHGACITLEKVKGQLEEVATKNCGFFIVCHKGDNVGVMDIDIDENNKGIFDIGLIKEYRGKGYGKKLLETAINFLVNKDVNQICLTVIEKNKIAFGMYKKRGFIISKIISDWTQL